MSIKTKAQLVSLFKNKDKIAEKLERKERERAELDEYISDLRDRKIAADSVTEIYRGKPIYVCVGRVYVNDNKLYTKRSYALVVSPPTVEAPKNFLIRVYPAANPRLWDIKIDELFNYTICSKRSILGCAPFRDCVEWAKEFIVADGDDSNIRWWG